MKWWKYLILSLLTIVISAVGTVAALTVLGSWEFDGIVIKAPQEMKLYTAPSDGIEISSGSPVHMGQLPRGQETVVTWWIVNEGVEPITPEGTVIGNNVNCPECDFIAYITITGTPTMVTGDARMITFNIYPSPSTPPETPFNATFTIESE